MGKTDRKRVAEELLAACESPVQITAEDMDDLRHMLGMTPPHSQREWGFRNYFCADPEHPGMRRLEALGWVRATRSAIVGSDQVFVATREGCRAVGLPEAKIAKLFPKT